MSEQTVNSQRDKQAVSSMRQGTTYNNCCLAIDLIPWVVINMVCTVALLEGFVPTSIAKSLQIFVNYVCTHDRL